MINLLLILLFLGVFVFLFFREIRLDHERFLEEHRSADEHFLKEVERFIKEKTSQSTADNSKFKSN